MSRSLPILIVSVCALQLFAVPDMSAYRVWVNQAGWEEDAPKIISVSNPPDENFEVQTIGTNVMWRTVLKGKWQPVQSGKKGLFWADISEITAPGDYRVVCGDVRPTRGRLALDYKGAASFHFPIRKGVYDTVERMFVQYFTWQRCGHKKGWAGVCHQERVPLVGLDKTLDVRGGYHQSCDLRNWHDGIPLSVYCLLRYMEMSQPLWDDGILDEELRWGLDYFLKVIAPEGYVYDAQFAPIGWGARDYYVAPATLGAQCNFIMVFARAANYYKDRDAKYSAQLLAAARKIYQQVEMNEFFAKPQPAPAQDLPAGAQPAEKCYYQQYRSSANGISERCGAALELYRATKEEQYKKDALSRGKELIVLQNDDGSYHLESDKKDAAFKDWSYCWRISGRRMALELFKEFGGEEFRAAALKTAEAMIRDLVTQDCRPGPQAAASTAAAKAIYLHECAKLFGKNEYVAWAQRSFDWIFGANDDCVSYVESVGQNQYQRPVFGQFFPSTPQIPGGVLHVMRGEYDMPAVALSLWATAELRPVSKSNSSTLFGEVAEIEEGTFVQTKVLKDLGIKLVSKGNYKFEKGNRFEYKILEPAPSDLTVTNDGIDAGGNKVRGNMAWARIFLNPDAVDEAWQSTQNGSVVMLKPKIKEVQAFINEVTIDKQHHIVKVVYPNGDQNEIKFYQNK